jgi:hypothetical protein
LACSPAEWIARIELPISRMIPITQIAYDRAVEFVEAPGFTALVSDDLDDDEYRGL